MSKRISFTVLVLVFVLVLSVLVSCKNTSSVDGGDDTQIVTSAEVSESQAQSEVTELIPESKPKNLDTSLSGVIFTASSEDMEIRFRNDGTGIIIGSVFVEYDKEAKTFLMDDGRKIELKTARIAEVDEVAYTYTKENYSDETQYFFDCVDDEKQLRIYKRDELSQMVVHLAFNYAMNEDMLVIDLDYKFHGKDAELYQAEYSIDDYRGTIQIGEYELDYSSYGEGEREDCILYPKNYSNSFKLYPNRKGEYSFDFDLVTNDDGKSFAVKNDETDLSIILINDEQAEVDGALFDYEIRERCDVIDIFSKKSKIRYSLHLIDNEVLPPYVMIQYEFDYTFDGTELKISFGGLLEDVTGEYDSEDNVMVIDQKKYTIVGTLPSPNNTK